MAKDPLRKLIDSLAPLGPDSAEKVVREVLKAGDARRRDAERAVAEVVAQARKSAEHFAVVVQREVAKQLAVVVKRIDTLEAQVDQVSRNVNSARQKVAERVPFVTRAASTSGGGSAKTSGADKRVAKQQVAKKSTTKKSTTKKSAAKKSAGKKQVAKKSGAKKSGAKKSMTSTGRSGGR